MGREPVARGGMAGGTLPVVPDCCTKPFGEEPGQRAGGHGNTSARLPETPCITGACMAGCWGYRGMAVGMEAPRSAQSPRLARLLCPSARLDPAEEKLQSIRVILSVNRVSLDQRFKMAQLLFRLLIRKHKRTHRGWRGKGFSWLGVTPAQAGCPGVHVRN